MPASAATAAANPAEPAAPPQALQDFVRLHAAMMTHATLREAALQLASDLAERLNCERVALGLLDGPRVVLCALSHHALADLRRREFDDLRAAMEEAIDQGCVLRLPEPPGAPPRVLAAHALLLARGVDAVLTVPLAAHGRALGALSFEWRGGAQPPGLDVDALAALAALCAPALALMQHNERGIVQRLKDAADERLARGTPLRRAAWIGTPLLALALLAAPLPEHVGGRARVEGAVERALAAPANGYLKAVHARPGDGVKAGQLLAELAEQDLEVDRRRLEGEVAQHESAYLAAMARSDRAQMGVALARMEEAKAQLELTARELGRTRIEAPFDGVVIAGDLSRSVGAPVKRGDTLLTVAPGAGWRIVVEVDEADIARVRPGQGGSLALASLPWRGVPVTVSRITPVARAVEGANVFEIEAVPAAAPGELRPGLQGAARLEVGARPLGWRALELVWTQARLAWWRLGF